MFGRRAPQTAAIIDRAFDEAEANIRVFGRDVASKIIAEHRAGTIDSTGINAEIETASDRTIFHASGVPKAMLRQILETLHSTIRTELASAGIEIQGLPA
jgi:chemotaxis methyl-accepting protein methylase